MVRPTGDKKTLGSRNAAGTKKPAADRKPAGSQTAGSLKKAGTKKVSVRRSKRTGLLIVTRPEKAGRPRWQWAAGAGAVLVILIVLLMLLPAREERGSKPSAAGTAGGSMVPGAQSPTAPGAPVLVAPAEKPPAFIKAVRLQPSTPTRLDTLKAEIEAAPGAPGGLVYAYLWKVNGRAVEKAEGDTLKLADFKKGDRLFVTVTPQGDGLAGFAVESPEVAIHPVAPSLELQVRPMAAAGGPGELWLVSVAPDSGRVIFRLEPPLLPDMSVDAASGKIAWARRQGQKGTFRFGASVEDDNGTKITKILDITVK